MTTLLGLGIGFVIAGFVRLYAGERFVSRIPAINIALAIISLTVWVIGGNSVAIALPIAIGLVFATLVLRMRSVASGLSRRQGAFFGAWMLLIASFATTALVRG